MAEEETEASEGSLIPPHMGMCTYREAGREEEGRREGGGTGGSGLADCKAHDTFLCSIPHSALEAELWLMSL